jgi:hypothetical protein
VRDTQADHCAVLIHGHRRDQLRRNTLPSVFSAPARQHLIHLPLLRTFWPGITPLFAFKPSILTRLHHRIEYAGRQTWSWIRAQEDRLNGRGGIRLLAVTLSRDRSPRHKYHHLRNKNRRPRLHSPRKSRRGGAIPTPERRQPRCQPLCRAALLPQHQHHRT